MPLRDLLLALSIMVVWGVNFVAIRWGVNEVPPLLLTALRYVVAAFPAVFFIRRPKVALGILIGYGLAVGVGQFGLLFAAIKFGMPAGLASLVIQLQAFFTIGLAVAFLGERPKGAQLVGALVAFAGIAVIAVERLGGGSGLAVRHDHWGGGLLGGRQPPHQEGGAYRHAGLRRLVEPRAAHSALCAVADL